MSTFDAESHFDPDDGEAACDDTSFKLAMQELHDTLTETKKVKTFPTAPKLKGKEEPAEEETLPEGVPYSHVAMIDLLVAEPNWTHKQYARHFGHKAGWFASVLAGDNFQQQLDLRRDDVLNPSVTATLEERFRALTLHSLSVLQVMMDNPKVQEATVLKAAELGIKALGMGKGKDDEDDGKKSMSLDSLADRLTAMLAAKGLGQAGSEHKTQQEIMVIEAMSPSDRNLVELGQVVADA